MATKDLPIEYVNGRFKSSALLREKQDKQEGTLYHFRIELRTGFCDIIFDKFSIKKQEGRTFYWDIFKQPFLIPKKSADELYAEAIAKTTEDFTIFLNMQLLYFLKDERVLDIARTILASDEYSEDARPYAVYIVGKMGDSSDSERLLKYLNSFLKNGNFSQSGDALLMYRNILDALENISDC